MPKNTPSADVAITHELIHTLLSEFVPELADEPLELVGSGWDNEVHRVGDTHAVRLPRREAASELVKNEQRWLPELEAQLPFAIPTPTFAGNPAFGYSWQWSVVPWLPGVPLAHAPLTGATELLEDIANFANALHVPAPDDAPTNPYRGVSLSDRTETLHTNLHELDSELSAQIRELWEELVDTPEWGGDPLWIHGDLHPLNVLMRAGRVSAVIDFGDLCAGDPATDFAIAWMLFDDAEREAFRKALSLNDKGIDVHTWNRSRAWALYFGAIYVTNSADNETMRRIGEATLSRVLDES